LLAFWLVVLSPSNLAAGGYSFQKREPIYISVVVAGLQRINTPSAVEAREKELRLSGRLERYGATSNATSASVS
jgi:hypothetical protein